MGLSRTVSEINGGFSRNRNISPPHVFCARAEGVPLGIGIPALKKTRMMDLPGRERSLTISSTVWIQSTNVTDRQKDKQTDTGRQQRPRLRIASRGNIVTH